MTATATEFDVDIIPSLDFDPALPCEMRQHRQIAFFQGVFFPNDPAVWLIHWRNPFICGCVTRPPISSWCDRCWQKIGFDRNIRVVCSFCNVQVTKMSGYITHVESLKK